MTIPGLLMATAAGLVTGLVFFRLLELGVTCQLRDRLRLQPLALWMGRLLLAVAVFRLLAVGGAPTLLVALIGFLLARQFSLRRVLRS